MMPPAEKRKLFTPLRVGSMNLAHRIIMSPLTRCRCPGGIPSPFVAEYYSQRATPGGMLISEGMHPSFMGGNLLNVPGMFSPEHIRAWKTVTDAVHAKGAYMVCQLWHIGRFAASFQLGDRQPLSSSETKIDGSTLHKIKGGAPHETAKAMTYEDIAVTIDDHVHAAKCAIQAGFDAVEITSGNGYLCDQFLNSNTNHRTDAYGGSKENRARLTLEILDAVVLAIGAERTALRFSPWGTVLMPLDVDPISTFTYVLSEVEKRGIAYVCLTQPRTDLFVSEDTKWKNLHAAVSDGKMAVTNKEINLYSFEEALKTTPKLSTGGYDSKNCFEEVENGELDAITFGRWFISNPDLVEKIRLNLRLAERDLNTTYTAGKEGYTDYPLGDVGHKEKLNIDALAKVSIIEIKS